MKYMLAKPEMLNIIGDDGKIYTGGSQEWYTDGWHIKAGCGPTVASNIIKYKLPELCGSDTQADFLKLMQEMISFITPGLRGVNSSAMFCEGFIKYGENHRLKFNPNVLEIPCCHAKRPTLDKLCGFILAALQADSPVAFLNLSNGTLENLDNWHWVTILALEPEIMHADICDQGEIININLGEWLSSSLLGGAFVYI